MQSLIAWLTNRFQPTRKPPESPTWRANLRPAQHAPRPKKPAVEPVTYDSDIGGRIENAGPGKNVLMRNHYVREDTGTHETLKIFSASIEEDEDEGGQDPYNSGQFDRTKSWRSYRTRK